MSDRNDDAAVRVLVVEDELAVAAGIADLLTTYGYCVNVVHTGGAAMAAAARFAPGVVILDVHLPDIGGEAIFAQLRGRWPDMPVVFSSGHVIQLADVAGDHASRVVLLRKPYEGEQLVRAIEQVMR